MARHGHAQASLGIVILTQLFHARKRRELNG
jgi:hypothetical protein